MHTVIILGAGASREAGAPLMADFIDRAEDLFLAKDASIRSPDQFELALRVHRRLRTVHARSSLALDNIESFLGVVEMGQLIGRLADLSADEIAQVPAAVTTMIVQTLEASIAFAAVPNKDGLLFRPMDVGWTAFTAAMKAARRGTVAIISFNYDILPEVCLAAEGLGIDYGLDPALGEQCIPLLKLHGSIHWASCTRCECIIPRSIKSLIGATAPGTMRLHPSHAPPPCCKCGAESRPGAVIVPPSWNKGGRAGALGQVWQHAAQELRKATHVCVLGYSMPETDAYVRYLLALGLDSPETRLRLLWVADPDPDDAVERRVRTFASRSVAHRLAFWKGDIGRFGNAAGGLNQLLTSGSTAEVMRQSNPALKDA